MMVRRLWSMVLIGALVAGPAAAPRPAEATLRFGALQISGNLQSQNLVRTPDASTWEFIQNRNTARLRLDYDWLEGGKFMTKYDIPFIERSSITLLWRGVYDSIYSFTPGFLQKTDIHGKSYGAILGPDGRPSGGRNVFNYATQVGFSSGTGFRRLTIDNL